MNLIPKIKKCVCCDSINFIKINGITYDNKFKSLASWVLKKKFNCRKCNTELGLFINNASNSEKLVWIDFLKCEDIFHNQLNQLQENKDKFKKNKIKYAEVLDEIRNIQNKIFMAKIKLKIKYRIEHNGMLIRHVY